MQTEVMQAGKIQGKRGISSAVLKNIAVVTMLIDHIGAVIVARLLVGNGLYEAMVNQEVYTAWMGQNGGMYGIYMAMRIIGRLAFPIYCFLLVEGFQKTHNVKKYLGRMFLFALISEVPFDLALSGKAWYPAYQNVFFTLAVGLMVCIGIRIVEEKPFKNGIKITLNLLMTIAGMAVAELLRTDYGGIGVLAIVMMYLLRDRRVIAVIACCIILMFSSSLEIVAFLALIPICFYNGERGWKLKWVFYIFYPAHLLILWMIGSLTGLLG